MSARTQSPPAAAAPEIDPKDRRPKVRDIERLFKQLKIVLDQEAADREKTVAILRRSELAIMLGLSGARDRIEPQDFDAAVERRVRLIFAERDRNRWWRRLLRRLRQPLVLDTRHWFLDGPDRDGRWR